MKIAVIVSTFPALTETFILNQITGLCDRGHQVRIFSRFKPIDLIFHPDVQKYDLLKITRYFPSVPDSKWRCRFKAAAWILFTFLGRPGAVVGTVRSLLRCGSPFSYPALFMALQIFHEWPDVVYVHYGHNGNLLVPLKQIKPSVPFITMFHGHDLLLGLEGGKDYYTRLFSQADLILANSEYTRDRLIEQGADPQRLQIHSVGIEVKKFPYREEIPDPDSKTFRVLTVGRLCEQKGIEYSIRAIRCLLSADPSISVDYRIVGSGPQEQSLKQLVNELGLSGQVRFLGALDQTGVKEQLLWADVFLLTSLREWLGVVLLEAQAAGLPVVATRVGGIPEAVDPGRSAILVPPQDPQATADALAECLRSPDKRREMGQAGRRHVEQLFDIEILNDRLEEMFHELCRNTEGVRRHEKFEQSHPRGNR